MIIGLTGGMGSGKSTVAKCFRELNIKVLDTDQIAHALVIPGQPAFQAIVEHFGVNVLQTNGTLNRGKLRSIIFESYPERQWLEQLLHPLIKQAILEETALIPPEKYIVIEIPLLFEANFQEMVDRVLVVDCDEKLQIERVNRRDGMNDATQAILKTQIPRTTRLAHAHDVILNEGSIEELKKKVLNLHLYYHELAKL